MFIHNIYHRIKYLNNQNDKRYTTLLVKNLSQVEGNVSVLKDILKAQTKIMRFRNRITQIQRLLWIILETLRIIYLTILGTNSTIFVPNYTA